MWSTELYPWMYACIQGRHFALLVEAQCQDDLLYKEHLLMNRSKWVPLSPGTYCLRKKKKHDKIIHTCNNNNTYMWQNNLKRKEEKFQSLILISKKNIICSNKQCICNKTYNVTVLNKSVYR